MDAGLGFFLCPNIKYIYSWACKHFSLYEQISQVCSGGSLMGHVYSQMCHLMQPQLESLHGL